MRTFALALGFTSCLFIAPLAAGEKLEADPEKSKITFVGSKPDGTKHEGGFKKFEATADADFEEPRNSSLRIAMATESLWADDPRLEGHLKNPDFFDIRKYPKIVFESTSIEPQDKGKAVIVGKLRLLDKEEELKVPVEVAHGDDQLTLKAKFKLDRTKWGMNYGVEGNKIDKEVVIDALLIFDR